MDREGLAIRCGTSKAGQATLLPPSFAPDDGDDEDEPAESDLVESDFDDVEDSDFDSLDEDFAAGSELVPEDDDLPLERLSVL